MPFSRNQRAGRAAGVQMTQIQHEARGAARVPPGGLMIGVLFFCSGLLALVYEIVFTKVLALTFGGTALAVNTVLATFMGGMALGYWAGGRVVERRVRPVLAYGLCELGIAAYCALTPALFPAVRVLYLRLASGLAPDALIHAPLRVALGAVIVLPPAVLMGLSLPLLVRFCAGRSASLGVSAGLLYGANTLGAALGALGTGYLLLPSFGVMRTTLGAAAATCLVGALGVAASRLFGESAAAGAPAAQPASGGGAPIVRAGAGPVLLFVLALSGFICFGMEVLGTHLLAVVAGSTSYSFSLMLFAFLLGLGAGAAAGRGLLARGVPWPASLAAAGFALAASILLGVFLWERIPDVFAWTGRNWAPLTFARMELARGLVCLAALFPPSFLLGLIFPLALEGVGEVHREHRLAFLGRAAALNTLGNIAGAWTVGFVLLPTLGALRSLQALALVAFALGAAVVAVQPGGRARSRSLAPGLAVMLLFILQPSAFDWTRLADGTGIYFRRQGLGEVIDHAESLDGGLTTVALGSEGSRPVRTLLSNGKFQGDDSPGREMNAQAGFSLAPLLHTSRRGAALLIGYGTGVSARVLADAGFRDLDIAEISGDVLRLAGKHFGHVNGSIAGRPGVRPVVADGRNLLALEKRRYDLIGMEISSIWISGAAALYNAEFYRLVRERLGADGVFQQWIQLHRISTGDIRAVIGTIRSEFRHVWLYVIGNQGVIVASNHDARPGLEQIALLDRTASLAWALDLFGGSASNLLDARVLTPDGVDELLKPCSGPGAVCISTDDNLLLEYSTPRGNVRDYAGSIAENFAFLREYGTPSPLAWTRLE